MLRTQIALFWKFLGFFQSPFTRTLHAVILGLVALQLLGGTTVSPSMYSMPWQKGLPLWGHAVSGVLILCLALLMSATSLKKRGFAHFFPYLCGDTDRLRQDIHDSLHLKIVGPRPGGLASSVQGLGLGALLLTALSGFLWLLLLRTFESMQAFAIIDVHGVAALLLALYFGGHGAMALLHFAVWQKKTRSDDK